MSAHALAVNIEKGSMCCLLAYDLRVQRGAVIEWLLTQKFY